MFKHVVNDAQHFCLLGGHEVVALHASAHLLVRILGVLHVDVGQLALDFDNFLSMY